MSNHPFFPFYTNDFFMGVSDFTAEEVGGYIRLLCIEWDKGGIPNDIKKIKQYTGCRRNAIASILTKFSLENDGFFRQKRLEAEREKKIEYSNKQKAIAESRWRKKDASALPTDIPEDMPKLSKRNASHSQDSLPKGKESKRLKSFIKPTLEEVQEFYATNDSTRDKGEYYFNSKEANGWIYGKYGTPVKDWKADSRNWIKREKENPQQLPLNGKPPEMDKTEFEIWGKNGKPVFVM